MYGFAVLLVLSAISVQCCALPLEEWLKFPFRHLPWFGQSAPKECLQTCDNLNGHVQLYCCTKHEKCCPPEKQGLCPRSEIMECARKTFFGIFSVSVACTFDNNCSGTMKCCPTTEFKKCCVEPRPVSVQGSSSGTTAVGEPAPDQKTGTQPVEQSKPEAGEGKSKPAEGKPEPGEGKPESGEGKPEAGEGKQESGEGKSESGEGKPELAEGKLAEPGEGKPEPGEGKPESGEGKPEPGEGKPESGEGKPEPGEGKQESGEGKSESGEGKPELGEENGPQPQGQGNGPEPQGQGNGPEQLGQGNGPESSQGGGSQANQGNESHNGSVESI